MKMGVMRKSDKSFEFDDMENEFDDIKKNSMKKE